jgi:Ran GTPase-activating protein (RanGAP) involved in mRNA processing and transport
LNLSNNHLCGVWVGREKGNYITEGINAIADALRVNGALTKLSLAKNKLGEEGTKFLCDALVGNNTLKELDLSGDCSGSGSGSNIGGTASAKHVANMLLVNGALTKLSLASNYLKEEGTKAICKALKQNKTLKELDLSGYDNIGRAAGAKHVADMLGVNGALTECNLRNNSSMGEEAQASIRNAVQGKAWFKLRL